MSTTDAHAAVGQSPTSKAPADLDVLIEEQSQLFLDRQPKSRALIERSQGVLAGGATSNWQIAEPQAVWMSHGARSAGLRCRRHRL